MGPIFLNWKNANNKVGLNTSYIVNNVMQQDKFPSCDNFAPRRAFGPKCEHFLTMMQSIKILCMNILHAFNLNHSRELFHNTSFLPNNKLWNKQHVENTRNNNYVQFCLFWKLFKSLLEYANAFLTTNLPLLCLWLYNNFKIEWTSPSSLCDVISHRSNGYPLSTSK
jgi:hypothetical protein